MEAVVEGIRRSGGLVAPELILVAVACVLFLFAAFVPHAAGQSARPGRWPAWSLAATLVALWAWLLGGRTDPDAASTLFFVADTTAHFARGTALAAGVVLILLTWDQAKRFVPEYFACLLTIIAGTSFVAAANDLVGLFLSLELISIPTYVLLYLSRRDLVGKETAIKYFLLSVFSSALVLYGMSFLYGAAGSTNLAVIGQAIRSNPAEHFPGLVLVAVVLVVSGLGFRVTAVPFHFYAPDVFAGTSTSTAALLAYVPKLAGFVALVRLVPFLLPPEVADASGLVARHATTFLVILSILTMTVGNLLALLQDNLKRLLAYSSVAHAGYMLVALAAGLPEGASPSAGPQAILFYLVVYGAMTLGAFATLLLFERDGRPIEEIRDLAGIGQNHPGIALMMAAFLFSLTGLPPTAGFWGKLNIFLAAWSTERTSFQILAVVMALNAAIGAWYYLRLIAVMYLDDPAKDVFARPQRPVLAGMTICAAATLVLFAVPGILWRTLIQLGP